VFENRDSVLFQIQEMLRTERITQEKAILHELETYNALVPEDRELSATLFVEYQERDKRRRRARGRARALLGERAVVAHDAAKPARRLCLKSPLGRFRA
jgi:hypothetical protein